MRWFALSATGTAALLLATSAYAAVSWTSTSTLTTSIIEPPVQFVKGDNADNRRYMRSFDLSTNGTAFTAEVKPRAGAEMTVRDVVRVDNSAGSSDFAIELTGTQIVNVYLERFEWNIRNGSTNVANLDYLAANPQATFTLPTGQVFTMDLVVDLADGAGRTNAGVSFDLTMEVTP